MITEQGIARLRGVLRRRRLPIVATAAITLAASVALIGALQPRYRASAVVRALESQPAREYVAPTVAEPTGERLRTLRLGVMSRNVIGQVADELNLPQALGKSREQVVDAIRSRMDVKVEGDDTFLLTYEDTEPVRAQAVANGVAKKFMEGQVARRREMATATMKALAEEAAKLKPQMDAAEHKVREFKLAHYGALPEQQEQNLRLLDQTTMEINIQATNLDLENERRRQLIASAMSPLRRQEDQLLSSLHEARTKYLPDHPEVKRIQAEFQETKAARIEEEKTLRRQARTHNPELMALEGEIQRTSGMLAGLRKRQEEVRSRVGQTAKNGQQLAALQAEFDGLHTKYAGVVSRLRDAELAAGLERGLANLRYDLVEGAALPTGAVFPNRPAMALAALLLCIGLSLGVGFALDRSDSRIYSPAELAAVSTGRPLEILACVPDIADGPPLGGSKPNGRPQA